MDISKEGYSEHRCWMFIFKIAEEYPRIPQKFTLGPGKASQREANYKIHVCTGTACPGKKDIWRKDVRKVAAKVALDVLKEGTFSKEFLSMYQNEWERTEDYRNIKKRYHLSNIFLPLSKIDKN
jgi:hypothetical protein